MKSCPACGYEPTPSKRRLLYLFRKHFKTLPVWEMTQRCWIEECYTVAEVTSELMRFFDCKTEADWLEVFPDIALPVVLSADERAELRKVIVDRRPKGVRYTGTTVSQNVPLPHCN